MNPEIFDQAARIENEHWWFAARREILGSLLERQPGLGAGGDVLEAGCGNGGNLPLLARFGSLHAFELNDPARERAQARGIGKVEKGWLPDGAPFGGKTFDLVAALDVIEHLDDDAGGIVALRNVLKPKGLLLLTVPAYGWLWSSHDEAVHHKRRYTRTSLGALVKRCGMEVTYASYFNTLLFPLGAGYIGLSNLGAKPAPAMSIPSAPVNAVLRSIFALEKHLVPYFSLPFGVSIVLCARRGG